MHGVAAGELTGALPPVGMSQLKEFPTVMIGAGLKMYLGHRRTKEWLHQVADLAYREPALRSGAVELFVMPSFPSLEYAVSSLSPLGVQVGAQDLFWEDHGPFTGEVSGAELAEIGCSLVTVGHVERRQHLGETPEMVSAKTAAAFRNGLSPVLCVGEPQPQDPEDATTECIRQVEAALAHSRRTGVLASLVLAYEPHWAIGAPAPADPQHIGTVCRRLKELVGADEALVGSRVIYGGSAVPGLLQHLDGAVDGLFLGRASHDPAALEAVIAEAVAAAPAAIEPGVAP